MMCQVVFNAKKLIRALSCTCKITMLSHKDSVTLQQYRP